MALKDYDTHELVEELAKRGFYSKEIGGEDPKEVLLRYMEYESEEIWCAGWLTGLESALLGDVIYETLVREAGGFWVWDGNSPNCRKFIEGFPER